MKALKIAGNFLIQLGTYLALVIDRLILVPFVFVSSYSVEELAKKKPDRYSTYVLIRVAAGIVALIIYLLLKWIF